MVGFTGSRSLPRQWWPLVAGIVASHQHQPLIVGCASGADQAVRLAAPAAQVIEAASFSGTPVARLVKRSVAVVHAVTASPDPLMVGFAVGPCPAGIAPARSWRSGRPASGTWSTLALAAGLGVPVVVFWCRSARATLPAWGQWSAASGGWQLHPSAKQLDLF
ncbi:MAG: hypothetical protein GY792_05585 [Gammaproteobacteria bacterium]|nr:hypothetical protein [Gammaproteobacteria bacterium]